MHKGICRLRLVCAKKRGAFCQLITKDASRAVYSGSNQPKAGNLYRDNVAVFASDWQML